MNNLELNYLRVVEKGKEFLAGKKIWVCGLVRNSGAKLLKNLGELDELGQFCDLTYCVIENDSEDNTVQILEEFGQSHNLILVSEKLGLSRFGDITSYERTSFMAEARNKYMVELDRTQDCDYTIIVDLDIQKIEIRGIYHSFGLNLDVVCANGIQMWNGVPVIYDTYPLIVNGECVRFTFPLRIPPAKFDYPILVDSAFGGVAIYKYSLINGLRYDTYLLRGQWTSEHVVFNEGIRERNGKIWINPGMIIFR